jgi:pyrroloquinoline quinone (PQQ) biosynthesis protein C
LLSNRKVLRARDDTEMSDQLMAEVQKDMDNAWKFLEGRALALEPESTNFFFHSP